MKLILSQSEVMCNQNQTKTTRNKYRKERGFKIIIYNQKLTLKNGRKLFIFIFSFYYVHK